jgi:hypothetical protein
VFNVIALPNILPDGRVIPTVGLRHGSHILGVSQVVVYHVVVGDSRHVVGPHTQRSIPAIGLSSSTTIYIDAGPGIAAWATVGAAPTQVGILEISRVHVMVSNARLTGAVQIQRAKQSSLRGTVDGITLPVTV